MPRKPNVDGYPGALAVVHELATQNALDLDDMDMADEAERQDAAIDTVGAIMEGHANLLGRLTVPQGAADWPPNTFEVADDADMGDAVPALCLCLSLARDNVLDDGSAESRRQARAVAVVEGLVGLHRHELAEAVAPRRSTPGPA